MTNGQPEAARLLDSGSMPILNVKLRPQLRRIQKVGWGLLLFWSSTLVVAAIVQPEPYVHGWRLVLELLFLGRAVSIADGIASGFGRVYLLFQNGLEDVVLLLIIYPWVVAAYEGVSGRRFIRITVAR